MRKLILTLLLCLLPVAVMAHDMSGMAMSHEPELGASAAFDAHGRLWVVDAADGHIRVRHSDDFGKTLSPLVIVNPVAERIYDEGENRPKIAFGPKGELYVSWSQPRAKPWTGYVRFSRSMDGGRHFSTPITVQHDLADITHRFDALAVDGHGRVVIAWIDKRDQEAAKAKGQPYLGAAVYYSWSDNEGRSFAPDHKLMEHSCECCRIALARTPSGEVAAFFRGVFGDNIRDHAYALLPTTGAPAHAERATFDDWHIAACPHQGPGLAIGADGVRHAVWYEAKNGPTIWYGQLDPDHPAKHKLKIGGPGAGHADVAVHGHTVWLTWNQVSAKGYTLMLRRSTDNGVHFDAARAISQTDGAAGSPQLLLWQGRAYVAWNTSTGFRLVPAKAQ
ncbi:sialidase family protein [Rhodanobacter sp. 115]|uniref:sialidase family protein n=1 Tax=Rhodanobacter sp. FW021-MT20 TaxID=1162282 RepID=UPI000261008C|nr:sialidase family protein [Rhodanobacter sp. 115]EIL95820.1 signal peptide protein [Rhodanobacter sp. 115]